MSSPGGSIQSDTACSACIDRIGCSIDPRPFDPANPACRASATQELASSNRARFAVAGRLGLRRSHANSYVQRNCAALLPVDL